MKTDIKSILGAKTKQALSSNILQADAIRKNIIVLDDLKNLIPALSVEEFEQLQSNILEHGCQTPIQIWQTSKKNIGLAFTDANEMIYVLIDGHNRFEICTKHKLPYEIYVLSFISLKEAKDYMINLQLGRRNLSPSQISYFRGLRYNNEKQGKTDNLPKGQNDPLVNLDEKTTIITDNLPKGHFDPLANSTADRLATEYKVSPKTIKRDAEFAKGLDKLSIDLRNDILTGTTRIDKNIIQKLGKLPELIEPIENIATLLLTVPSVEIQNPEFSADINLNSTELILISQKFAVSKQKSDLQELIKIAQATLKMI